MARFDVYAHKATSLLLLDVQADLLSDLKTRAVIPLVPYTEAKREKVPSLVPVLTIRGKKHMMMTPDIASIKLSTLGKLVENIEPQRQAIIGAMDFLFQGF
jgi:toxin CcdB